MLNALSRKEPLNSLCEELCIVFEEVSVADNCLKEEQCGQMAVILQVIPRQKLLHEHTVWVVCRVFIAQLTRDDLMQLNYRQ